MSLNKKLLSLFYKSNFPKGSIVIDGIKYMVEPYNNFEKLNIYTDNIADVSTTRINQIGSIEELVYNFSKFVNSSVNYETFKILMSHINFYTDLDKNEVYLNNEDTKIVLDIYENNKESSIKFRTFNDEIIDINYSAKFIGVSNYETEIIVNDIVKITFLSVDGFESSDIKNDFFKLYENEDELYDSFRDGLEFEEVISFFHSRSRLIDHDSDVFVAFNHKFIF
jgi:hypothetical protein